jgi:hypothetical protein
VDELAQVGAEPLGDGQIGRRGHRVGGHLTGDRLARTDGRLDPVQHCRQQCGGALDVGTDELALIVEHGLLGELVGVDAGGAHRFDPRSDRLAADERCGNIEPHCVAGAGGAGVEIHQAVGGVAEPLLPLGEHRGRRTRVGAIARAHGSGLEWSGSGGAGTGPSSAPVSSNQPW